MRKAGPLAVSILILTACATPADLPAVRYLDAAVRGAEPPRVGEAEFHRQAQLWRDAVVDANACGLPRREVVTAAFAARSELTAMRDFTVGDTRGVMANVLGEMFTSSLTGHRVRPERSRCRRLAAWLPTVQARREQAGDWSLFERLLQGPLLP